MSRHAIIAITTRLGPMSAKQLAAELRIDDSTVRTCIRRARAHGTKYLRIARWAGDVAMYGPGPEPDAEGGSTGERIMQLLTVGERASVATMARLLAIDTSVLDPAVRRLRAIPGKLHIVGWERRIGARGGREGAIYMAGPGRDAPRPDFTNSQRDAERRRNEKRRIQKTIDGVRPRAKRTAETGQGAGFFDGLIR